MPDWNDIYHHHARVADDFDWEDDRPLEILKTKLSTEMHVRSFSRHPSSGEASGIAFAIRKNPTSKSWVSTVLN